MIVKIDKTTGDIEITLPEDLSVYKNELNTALIDEFSFESSSKNTLDLMNQFVINWFANKGITLSDDN
jgi:sRNA-binding carbon storage regulator CsrA